MQGWPFSDPPNTASLANRCVVDKIHPILGVTHDADDGTWQFLCGESHETEPSVVGLGTMLRIDETLASVANLPLGWIASRLRVQDAWRWSKAPRLLSEEEFRATCKQKMLEITGHEDDLYPKGVIDIEPYLQSVPGDDLQGTALVPGSGPAAVYLSGDGQFTHVLYRCNRSNVYLVVVVKMNPDDVFGHYVLDLGGDHRKVSSETITLPPDVDQP